MLFTGSGNANRVSGVPVESGTPVDGETIVYNAAQGKFLYAPGGSGGGVVPTGYTVAALPAAGSNVGMLARVTDALNPVIYEEVVGGGAAFAIVVSNGSIWRVLIV